MSIAKRASKILFYGVPATTESGAVTYHRMTNFTEATTSKNPKEYSRQYVDEESERSDVVGYAPSTSYAFDLDPENPVHKDIVSITDGEKIGPEAVRELFAEYTHMLVAHDPYFQAYLDLQHYDAEVADPTQKYGLPDGRLYVAWCDGQPAGCIALRRLDGTTCELKRLYVRPAFRGRGIAGAMMQRILDDARAIGYTAMLLDTLPFLTSAIRMYRALGFYDIPPYNDSPLDTTIFLRLDL